MPQKAALFYRGGEKCGLAPRLTGLPQESVANVSQIVTLDKALLTEHVGKPPLAKLKLILAGIDIVLGR